MGSLQHGIECVVAQSILSPYGARKVVLLLSFVALSWKLDRKV